ncbi:hypothetical protein GCM10027445_65980 [Amycolatopsis endophytica]|uniref:Uncharacterized protein n=1 Tax=Amycolatopsis endophytica TaxID=860233 RepID=A0A853B4Q1_9PSEU|nr:hypothetical protein [Amycolatopsis endophytica]NYI89792.1 hypothetical protein [Amycolatopsis endophytica]
MGRHRIDEAGTHPRWGGPALTSGPRRDATARHARPDDDAITQPFEGALSDEVVTAAP